MKVNLETIDSLYSELFTVKFAHSAYETPMEHFLSQGISIVPDADTKEFFTNYKMDYRFYNNTLVCYTRSALVAPPAAQPRQPSVKIDGNIRLRFLIRNSSDFFGKTFIAPAGNKKIYQFSNQTTNIVGADLFLTASVDPYASANDYDQGTIVQNGGNLFGALQPVAAASGIPITNTSFWKPLTPFEQVVSNADLQPAATVDTDEVCFAVIDIYNNGTSNDSYKLFDAGNDLFNPAPSFTIKFKGKY